MIHAFKRIGVVGAGAMGRGIVQLFASSGIAVRLYDSRPDAIDEALTFNRGLLERAHTRGKLDDASLALALDCMTPAPMLDDLADCDLVIEAIVENLEAKQGLFRELEARVGPTAVLASNTSSLSVSRIASGCRYPGRVAGLHFFNPVPLMKVVEVVCGARTETDVIQRLVALVEQAGHFAAQVPDSPGFLVNHAGRAYGPEALRILSEGIATPQQIDRILRDSLGFPMGPFELFDLMGLDVSHSVMESVHEQFYQDPRYTPSALVPPRLAAGLLGRKSGEGFYRYMDGKPVPDEPAEVPTIALERPFWLDCEDAGMRAQIGALLGAAGAVLETGEAASAQAICVVTPLGEDASSLIARKRLPARRTLALDTFAGFDRRRVLMRQPALAPQVLAQARQAFGADGVPVEVINDSPGFIAQRVLAGIVNLGCEIAQRRIADPATLDRAVELALGYPQGPLRCGDNFGPERIMRILHHLHELYQDPRYRVSPWLRRRVQLGLPLITPEQTETLQ
ncbi:3-hydroxyacyl-CoA dehydrogenase [Marinobacterium rhizophilum]|uniref:3-hydroxyacyl-CoA dehydrogenase n=1 Tax=Marinobacterium rhizophilum TaxID=420402 RepID=A0ABY5HGG5_9GAMM|nr:3-hydroxyacyl-CoA dehydrogenase [Marinobacterium rhizophilum]UTW11458.1 3-hydroxyacyl-CoA dehydrogenase [Marinobacterium rhizophilum]